MKKVIILFTTVIGLSSCVSTKKFEAVRADNSNLMHTNIGLTQRLTQTQDDKVRAEAKVDDLTKKLIDATAMITSLNVQNDYLKKNNNQVLNQLTDLSVVSKSQAESIKKSMDNISGKDQYIQNLQSSIAKKDSLTMTLIMNLKGAIGDLNDKDIEIKIEKGVVYIDISDKLLFKSGKYDVTSQAEVVLGKIAKVLNAHKDIEFMVEGNTDSVPYKDGVLLDNWDLSVKRATAVTRILQHKYGMDPAHITAAGRSEYTPVQSNNTAAGRAANRRTRIIILPQLDQFFKLLEKK